MSTAAATPAPAPRPAPPAIREATPVDVEGIVRVVNLAYRTQGGWTTEEHLVGGARTDAEDVRAAIADDTHLLLVAERDGALVGCCYTDRQGDSAELGLFAVDPTVQAGGVGGALMEEQAKRRADEGLASLHLRVLESRPELQAWYARHGFVETGEVVPFAGDAADLKVPGLGMAVMVRALA
ncbi:GNAT family N-acetyltransferase [Brachybacterium sp. NPDC056505]|uniref:GNAT family N-acetyltransferase n=1 Tax=Brachybacterium sp. NPDC056505 TaxID=3345843 RepID=UPI00366B3CEB